MSKRQLFLLFICSLIPFIVGNGLLPLLPVYAVQLGADPAVAGYYLAFSYLALTVGGMAAGWISDTFQRRRMPLIVVGLAAIPIAWMLALAGNLWGLSLLTALLWFCGGLGAGLIGILTGLSAGEEERGKVFGVLSMTGGLGALIGGLATGFIADRSGFPAMFSAMAVLLILWPLASLFLTEEEIVEPKTSVAPAKRRSALGRSYVLLSGASLVASIAVFVVILARSLLMSGLGFGALEISSTGAVSGIVAMPLPFLMGWLSDRVGRKLFLGLAYLAGTASLAVLAISTSFWQFFIVSILQAMVVGANATLGNAIVTDLVPKEWIGRGLALFTATPWIGGVLGFAGTGYALQNLGIMPTILLAACLSLLSVASLVFVRADRREQASTA